METVAIDTHLDGRLAVLVRPTAPGPWPGVVMIHEAWGLDDVLRRQATRLASAGFLVLAPDLYGAGSRLRCMISTFKAFKARTGLPFDILIDERRDMTMDGGQPDRQRRGGSRREHAEVHSAHPAADPFDDAVAQ